MTEEEAKKCWCPFARQPIPQDCGWLGAYNRTETGETGTGCMCLGSQCMMWRTLSDPDTWHETKKCNDKGEYIVTENEPFGYCGLAGKP